MTRYLRAHIPGGSFFFTVNLLDRRSSLLTAHAAELRAAFRKVRERHPFHMEAIVLLPDHLHAIWTLPRDDADFSLRWSLVKAIFARAIPASEFRSQSRQRHRERGVWQRRFWEHALRDATDFARHCDYIHYNPVKHGYVRRVQSWPYSSFHRFVQRGLYAPDWGDAPPQDTLACGERDRSP